MGRVSRSPFRVRGNCSRLVISLKENPSRRGLVRRNPETVRDLAGSGVEIDKAHAWIDLMKNIYVGNLAYGVTDDDLRDAFAAFGEVARAKVIMDRDTGRSKGFGFVEMPDDGQAQAAIDGLNEQPINGRNVRVNEARPRDDRPRR
jgi:RNA recognition motif-containing protein